MTSEQRTYVAAVFDSLLHFVERGERGVELYVQHRDYDFLDRLQRTTGVGSVRESGKGYKWAVFKQADIHALLSEVEGGMYEKRAAAWRVVGWCDEANRARRSREARLPRSRGVATGEARRG